jgi:hypothetical protein
MIQILEGHYDVHKEVKKEGRRAYRRLWRCRETLRRSIGIEGAEPTAGNDGRRRLEGETLALVQRNRDARIRSGERTGRSLGDNILFLFIPERGGRE